MRTAEIDLAHALVRVLQVPEIGVGEVYIGRTDIDAFTIDGKINLVEVARRLLRDPSCHSIIMNEKHAPARI